MPVTAAEPIFVRPKVAGSIDRAVKARLHTLPLVGMQPVSPEVQRGRDFGFRVAEQFLDAVAPPELARGDVQIPDGVGGGAGGKLQPFVALGRGGFRRAMPLKTATQ